MSCWKISPCRGLLSVQRFRAPTSKSYAARLLILAALKSNPVKIFDVPDSSDVLTLLDCLKKIGLRISRIGPDVVIENSFPACEPLDAPPLTLSTGDGGTTNRFLLGLLSRGKRIYRLCPSGRIKERPIRALLEALRFQGAQVSVSDPSFWCQVQGPIAHGKRILVDASDSSQMASSLGLALADTKAQVVPENLLASRTYWSLTEKLVCDFKKGCLNWRVPVDWSGVSPLLGVGLLLNPVAIENCKALPDPLQADGRFIGLIKEMGGNPRQTPEGLQLFPVRILQAIKVDARHFPDLIPTLSFVCSYATGTSVFTHLEILRRKESDRLAEIQRLLNSFGVSHAFKAQTCSLEIYGPTPRNERPITYMAPSDHRMIMSAALFMRYNAGGNLFNVHPVAKSFPRFEREFCQAL